MQKSGENQLSQQKVHFSNGWTENLERIFLEMNEISAKLCESSVFRFRNKINLILIEVILLTIIIIISQPN